MTSLRAADPVHHLDISVSKLTAQLLLKELQVMRAAGIR